MASVGLEVALPFNERNFQVPSQISLWAQTICEDGSLDTAFDIGTVEALEFIPNETRLDMTSARTGIMTTALDYVTRVEGQFKFTMAELVGSNLDILFKPRVVTPRRTSGNLETILGATRVRLSGTTPVAFASEAVEPAPGNVSFLAVTVVDVRDLTGATTYNIQGSPTDYLIENSDSPNEQVTIERVSGSTIPDGSEVYIRYTFEREGQAYSFLDGLVLELALTLQVMSINGPQSLYRFFRTSVGIDGSILVNPEERKTATITAKILPRGDGLRGEFVLLDNFSRFAVTECA